jgi:GTP cyclohydrolase II
MAIVRGDIVERAPLLTRVHSSCLTSECLMAGDCDCAQQLDRSLAMIASEGRGVVFYLMQEGRGAGLSAKARDRMIVQASGHRLTTFDAYAEMGLPSDLRCYDCLGPMASALGIRGPLELLTNNPEKAEGVARSLANEKIDVTRMRAIESSISPFNLDYLRAKRQSGHFLARDGAVVSALPPESIAVEDALRSDGHPHLISTAHYFLPVLLSPGTQERERVDWFRMRVVYDRHTARESVLLSLGNPERAAGREGGGVTLSLLDRLPCSESQGRVALRATLLSIRDQGAGRVAVHFDDENPHADREIGCGIDVDSALSKEMLAARWLPVDGSFDFSETGETDDAER